MQTFCHLITPYQGSPWRFNRLYQQIFRVCAKLGTSVTMKIPESQAWLIERLA
jgi:hypothetical protein